MVCVNADDAARMAVCNRMHLAIIDLATAEGEQLGAFKQLTERLSHGGGSPLLMICARETDAEEEIWARQLGVWAYLPGVDADSDMAMLCGEAKNVAEKHCTSAAACP